MAMTETGANRIRYYLKQLAAGNMTLPEVQARVENVLEIETTGR